MTDEKKKTSENPLAARLGVEELILQECQIYCDFVPPLGSGAAERRYAFLTGMALCARLAERAGATPYELSALVVRIVERDRKEAGGQ